MRYRALGATGMTVSEYALGAMMFGSLGNTDHDDSIRIIHRALDAGITLIDTADVYGRGESEVIVGKAIKGCRDDLVIATKFGRPMSDEANHRGASRRWIVRAVEDSLRRLGTDHIDLYQLHRPDHATAVEETLGALSDLVRAGKIRTFGSSMFPAELIVEAQWAADRRATYRFTTEQPMYSIFTRGPEAAVFPTAQRYGLGVLTFSPLNSGWLTANPDIKASHRAALAARLAPQQHDPSTAAGQKKTAAAAHLADLAAQAGMTVPHLAVAFARAHPAVTSVLIGPRTQAHLETLLDGAEIELTPDILDRIDDIVPPGTDLDPADNYAAAPPALTDPSLRRR